MISVTAPAPTVRPPSRMAKRRPSSIAIGVINWTSIFTSSPGMTISTSGKHNDARDVGRAEVKLRAVAVEERRVTSAFFL